MKLNIFPIPHIADLSNHLEKATVFSFIDLSHAYHQVCIHEGDEHKTAFLAPQELYEYVVIPISLTNAPAMF